VFVKQKMLKNFEWWFCGIDLNKPMDEEDFSGFQYDGAGTSTGLSGTSGLQGDGAGTSARHSGASGLQGDAAGTSAKPSGASRLQGEGARASAVPTGGEKNILGVRSAPLGVPTGGNVHSGARTGVTLSNDVSGGKGEVQSIPEGFVPKTAFVGIVFDSLDAALVHYSRYAKHVSFSTKIESSRKSTRDGEKDKCVFVCNNSGKNTELEEAAPKKKMCTITVRTGCKAKLQVKHVGARWQVK
jgi:hypothetical protein